MGGDLEVEKFRDFPTFNITPRRVSWGPVAPTFCSNSSISGEVAGPLDTCILGLGFYLFWGVWESKLTWAFGGHVSGEPSHGGGEAVSPEEALSNGSA